MPWHDVHTTFIGTVVLDVVQHFVERWNEVKKRKVLKSPKPLERPINLFVV